MDEFDDDDDVDFNAPLDVRFVVVGLGMLIFGLFLPIFYFENIYFKYLCLAMFATSFS